MEDGYKAIETIEAGDRVFLANEELQELKVKKDAKLEKISDASDELLAMALRKLMSDKSGKGQK